MESVEWHGQRLYPVVRIADNYISAYTRLYARKLIKAETHGEVSAAEFRRIISEEYRTGYSIDTRFTA